MTRTSNKKSKKMLFLLFTAITAMIVGVVWAAVTGSLTIGGTINLNNDLDVVFETASGATITNDHTLTFEADLADADVTKVVTFTFTLKNISLLNDADILSITPSFVADASEALVGDFSVLVDYDGSTFAPFKLDANTGSEEFEVSIEWIAHTDAVDTVHFTFTIAWALAA